eukprot:4970568-Amphidinium_carterae.1
MGKRMPPALLRLFKRPWETTLRLIHRRPLTVSLLSRTPALPHRQQPLQLPLLSPARVGSCTYLVTATCVDHSQCSR